MYFSLFLSLSRQKLSKNIKTTICVVIKIYIFILSLHVVNIHRPGCALLYPKCCAGIVDQTQRLAHPHRREERVHNRPEVRDFTEYTTHQR